MPFSLGTACESPLLTPGSLSEVLRAGYVPQPQFPPWTLSHTSARPLTQGATAFIKYTQVSPVPSKHPIWNETTITDNFMQLHSRRLCLNTEFSLQQSQSEKWSCFGLPQSSPGTIILSTGSENMCIHNQSVRLSSEWYGSRCPSSTGPHKWPMSSWKEEMRPVYCLPHWQSKC